ncbi:RNA polymerase sigma-70 factor, ECF subfamily [Filimonas lacunae]|uniref:RNA polymerase sigma-70 factor, ECF subfamily n=1 Tax=Filimonas lacunae TaxID=477680 RepID=A0A173MFS6_9BACT|nr:RNA polymerase sigma factor [Filimonas lacunae]BAV06340.1 RNA polymerase ECF-type sigma factor [Filimonas lacunae]SIT25878.1 RNA polymerase sigma-70 factor, ECF subfamily [Filimonas lacunae]
MQASASFIALLTEHRNIIYKVCNLYMDDKEQREDLFQEITLQAWKSFSHFRGDAKFGTWLYRVALNTAITYFKKEQRRAPVMLADNFPDIADSHDPADEQLMAMYKAIATLSKIDKALIMLYLEDYSYQEIGEMLGITANNVAVKMNRVKIRLKEESKKHYEPAQ